MRFADELNDAAEAAEPETPAPPPAKVDPLTYVFGAPGELKGDMARMGTSPRRVLLVSLGVLAIALAADLFRITSTILRIAPSNMQEAARRARLDTYYPIGDFKRYIDDEYRFEVRYPERWLGDQAIYVSRMQGRSGAYDAGALLKSRKQKGPAALAGFGPAGNTLAGNTAGSGKFENLSVFRSPVDPGLKLRNLGSPTEFAQRLLDTAVASPESGKKTTLLAASERADGAGPMRLSTVSSCPNAATARRAACSIIWPWRRCATATSSSRSPCCAARRTGSTGSRCSARSRRASGYMPKFI